MATKKNENVQKKQKAGDRRYLYTDKKAKKNYLLDVALNGKYDKDCLDEEKKIIHA